MNRLVKWLSFAAILVAASLAPAQEKADFKHGTLWMTTDSDGRSELDLWMGWRSNCKQPTGFLRIVAKSGLFDPHTRGILLNKTVEITNERNGHIYFNYGDTGESGESAKVTFSRMKKSTVWGQYEVVARGGTMLRGSFVVRICSQSRL